MNFLRTAFKHGLVEDKNKTPTLKLSDREDEVTFLFSPQYNLVVSSKMHPKETKTLQATKVGNYHSNTAGCHPCHLQPSSWKSQQLDGISSSMASLPLHFHSKLMHQTGECC